MRVPIPESPRRRAQVEFSVSLPFHNEEANVDAVLIELFGVLSATGEEWEVVAVDDGSTDGTLGRLRALACRQPRLRVLRLRRNAGQTAAMQAGFEACRGRWVVSMDGDGQNDPSAIPDLLADLKAGADLVCGWRERRQDRLMTRKVPSWVANRLIAGLTGVPIHDNGCSLKAYRRDLLERLRLYSDQHRFIPALSALSGARIVERKVPHRARHAGVSKYGLSRTYKVALDVITLVLLRRAQSHPGRAFLAPAVLLALAGFAWTALALAGALGGRSLVVTGGVGFLLLFLAGHFLVLAAFAVLLRAQAPGSHPPPPVIREQT